MDHMKAAETAHKKGDYKTANKHWKISAEQGLPEAQCLLGVMYRDGEHGAPQHYLLAHMWFNLAGSNGHKGAIDSRDLMEERLSPTQIEKAQEMARDWELSNK